VKGRSRKRPIARKRTSKKPAKARPVEAKRDPVPPRRLPWLKVYVRDWLGSPKLARLSTLQEGMLVRLLLFAWESPGCLLPTDENELCAMTKITAGMWEDAGGPRLLTLCFERRGDGYVPVEPIDLAAQAYKAEDIVSKRIKAGKDRHRAPSTRSAHAEHTGPGPGPGPGPDAAVKECSVEREGGAGLVPSVSLCTWQGIAGGCRRATEHHKSLCADHERAAGVESEDAPENVAGEKVGALDPDHPDAEKELVPGSGEELDRLARSFDA